MSVSAAPSDLALLSNSELCELLAHAEGEHPTDSSATVSVSEAQLTELRREYDRRLAGLRAPLYAAA